MDAPTGPDQTTIADGGVWESYDATAYTHDEDTGAQTPEAPDTWAWRLVALAPTVGADRVDAQARDGRLIAERVWDTTAGTITERTISGDAVSEVVRPMTDDEAAIVAADAEQRQVATLRAEVGEPLDSAEVDASLAALTEDSIQYRVAIQVLVQTLVPQAQQAAVMAAIEGGKGQAQARLAEVYDDPEQRRAALTSRIAAAREATRGEQ